MNGRTRGRGQGLMGGGSKDSGSVRILLLGNGSEPKVLRQCLLGSIHEYTKRTRKPAASASGAPPRQPLRLPPRQHPRLPYVSSTASARVFRASRAAAAPRLAEHLGDGTSAKSGREIARLAAHCTSARCDVPRDHPPASPAIARQRSPRSPAGIPRDHPPTSPAITRQHPLRSPAGRRSTAGSGGTGAVVAAKGEDNRLGPMSTSSPSPRADQRAPRARLQRPGKVP
jgi:hypothetical protein